MQSATCKPIAVFLGPSLPRAEAESLLDADYYPPARHGDVYRLLASGVRLIVLIDGVFHDTPSVWQRELLAALDEGIAVIGAASMGALRAAELHPFGMRGCGTVFEWYKNGVIEADDEVALLHAEADYDYRAFSEPLVNIRATLASARDAGLLSAAAAQALVGHVRARHYSERSYDALWDAPLLKSWPTPQLEGLRARVTAAPVNVKAADARAALRLARTEVDAAPAPLGARRDRSIWDQIRALYTGVFADGRVVTTAAIVTQAWKTPELWAAVVVPGAAAPRQAVTALLYTRFFALRWAERARVSPADTELAPLQRAVEARLAVRPTPLHLAANGLTARTYTEILAERARYEWLLARPGVFGGPALVALWADAHGVTLPQVAPAGLVAAIIDRGPLHFGYDWNFEVAFARELQLCGLAATILRSVPS